MTRGKRGVGCCNLVNCMVQTAVVLGDEFSGT